MTTATDWDDATWTDTGEIAVVTDVMSAAVDAPVRAWRPGDPWTPGPDMIPDHVATLLKPLSREQLDAETTPAAGDHIPGCDDLRKSIDLTMASYRLVLHQEAKAQLWHEVASQAWAHQGERSRISDTYTARREALVQAYERERDALVSGLRGPEYGGHVYDPDRGFVAAGPPHRLPPPPPPPDRPEVQAMTERVQRRDVLAGRPAPETEPPAIPPSQSRRPWWRRLLERWG